MGERSYLIFLPAQTIGASYGDAFLAGLAAGMLERKDLEAWVKVSRYTIPDDQHLAQYGAYYREYLRLYEQTRGIVHKLGELGGSG